MEAKRKILFVLKSTHLVCYVMLFLCIYSRVFNVLQALNNTYLFMALLCASVLLKIASKLISCNLLKEKFENYNGEILHKTIQINCNNGYLKTYQIIASKLISGHPVQEGLKNCNCEILHKNTQIPSGNRHLVTYQISEGSLCEIDNLPIKNSFKKCDKLVAFSCLSSTLFALPLILVSTLNLGEKITKFVHCAFIFCMAFTLFSMLALTVFTICRNLIQKKKHSPFNSNSQDIHTNQICSFISLNKPFESLYLSKTIGHGVTLHKAGNYSNEYCEDVLLAKFIKSFIIENATVLPVNFSQVKNSDGTFNILGLEFDFKNKEI